MKSTRKVREMIMKFRRRLLMLLRISRLLCRSSVPLLISSMICIFFILNRINRNRKRVSFDMTASSDKSTGPYTNYWS